MLLTVGNWTNLISCMDYCMHTYVNYCEFCLCFAFANVIAEPHISSSRLHDDKVEMTKPDIIVWSTRNPVIPLITLELQHDMSPGNKDQRMNHQGILFCVWSLEINYVWNRKLGILFIIYKRRFLSQIIGWIFSRCWSLNNWKRI